MTTAAAAAGSRHGQPLWRDRRFATYWVGQGVSEFGDRISELALPLIAVITLHEGPTAVGFLTAAVWAPNLVSLVVGSWVERRPQKRRVMISADLLRFAVLATLPIAHVLGVVSMAQLIVVALLAGFGQVLDQTAYQPFFVALVRRDQFIEANSLLSGTRSVSFIAGPAVGGGLIQLLTAPLAVGVDALSFVLSALMTSRVHVDEGPAHAVGSGGLLRRAREGMRFVTRHPYLRWSLGCASTLNFFSFVAAALVILFANRHLGLSAGVIGLAFGIGAFGGLLGALIAGRLSRAIGIGHTIAAGAILFALPYSFIPLAAGPHWARAAVLGGVEFVSGFGVMCFDVNLNAFQTVVTPDAMRSRVSGAYSTVNYGVRPLGAMVGGVLGSTIGIGPAMVLAGVGGALSFLWLLPSPIFSTRSIEGLGPVEPPNVAPSSA
jgi:MFS family permease